MLSLTKLTDAEYLLNQVAHGLDDYYVGSGEAPGVWHGAWAAELGVEGVVDGDHLRSLLEGFDPVTGGDLSAGKRERTVKAFDATFSAPKSCSLLWAFGPPELSTAVAIAHVEAVGVALDVLEERAVFARQQVDGARRRVGTRGLAAATFVHRTSREGDPQLHTHCVIPNLARRDDGSCVALDGGPLWIWKKAVGSVYQEELRRRLTERLGVAWGPDRNGTRELVGISADQLRRFSKRTVAIEAELARLAIEHADRATWMAADERASVRTRPDKDPTLTPERLRRRWQDEAADVGLPTGATLAAQVCGRTVEVAAPSLEVIFTQLVDPEAGVCSRRSRFNEAHVVEAVAALGGGTMSATDVLNHARAFLASSLVVRLAPDDNARQRPPEWSTAAHLATERHVLDRLATVAGTCVSGAPDTVIAAALCHAPELGNDQRDAVRVLARPGSALRVLVAPAGHGKTSAVRVAAAAMTSSGRPVLGLATTNKAVEELARVGVPAMTVARFRLAAANEGLRAGTTLILDEVSQVATADAAWLLDTVAAVPGTALWCLGDARQGQAVRAGGLAGELERLAADGTVVAAGLSVNRRQLDPADRAALTRLRAGDVTASQTLRRAHGWEHDVGNPTETRQAMAEAVVADADRHGVDHVAALAVSHADCEDLADRIRALRRARGELGGAFVTGPAWGVGERQYAAGDRILVHATLRAGGRRVHTGTVLTVTGVTAAGLTVSGPSGHGLHLPAAVVAGRTTDGAPLFSHAWARTVDGAQGGTWAQVHLLGTDALDRYTGYVGQSRGRHATHTWNVRRHADVDHGGILADQRDAAEVVHDALVREPDRDFAVGHDPRTVAAALERELAAHRAVVARRPPDVAGDLDSAIADLERARDEHRLAIEGLDHSRRELAAIGPVARMRRVGRDEHARALARLEFAEERLQRAGVDVAAKDGRVADLRRDVAERAAWDRDHGWRLEHIRDLHQQLDHHWARAVLGATCQGDPLAFGLDRLRDARAAIAADLRMVDATIPADRSRDLQRAEQELHHRQAIADHARRALAHADARLRDAQQRRWGRRDRATVADAEHLQQRARYDVEQAQANVVEAQQRVDTELAHAAARHHARNATAAQRADLVSELRLLGDALEATRAERVLAAARREPGHEHLVDVLGSPPDDAAATHVWCGIAHAIETYRDAHARDDKRIGPWSNPAHLADAALGPRPANALACREWDRVARYIADAHDLVAVAGSVSLSATLTHDADVWHEALTHALVALDATTPQRARERDLGRGLDVGW